MQSCKIPGSLCTHIQWKCWKRMQRVLICINARKYHPVSESCTMEDTGCNNYRVTTYIGDKKNLRGSNSSGKASKRRNSTLRDCRRTCSAKIVIRFDDFSFHLVCGLGDNNHIGHPPMAPNKITNRKLYLDIETVDSVATMAAANILPAQVASLTRIKSGELFTRGQMAYIQGCSRMAKDYWIVNTTPFQTHLRLIVCFVIFQKVELPLCVYTTMDKQKNFVLV